MSVKIKVFFDYVCPFCYLEFHALKKALEECDAQLEFYPKELRRPPKPKVDPMHDEMRLKRFAEVIKPAAEKLGIPMELPYLSPHPYTTDAFLGYLFAEHAGKGMEYTEKIFHTFYVEQKDIGELSVLKEAAEEIGLPAEAFEAEVKSQKRLPELDSYKKWAEAYEIQSLPTLIIGEEKVVGCLEPEEYAAIIERAASHGNGMHCDMDGNCGY